MRLTFFLFCMVISILIPIYNRNVVPLVNALSEQAKLLNIPYEIICLDDCSKEHRNENSDLNTIANVSYIELEENIGRSKIRNKLAEYSQYEHLLFIDNDMLVFNPLYLKHYVDVLPLGDCIYGGLTYVDKIDRSDFYLRWYYGTMREAISVEQRNRSPYISIKPCNLLINKKIFNAVKFDERFSSYGHEDTLFSLGLEAMNAKVVHIDNPLLHDGLEDAEVFLMKLKSSCINLKHLIASQSLSSLNSIKLVKVANLIIKFRLHKIYTRVYALFSNGFENNLKSTNASLIVLDLFKLNEFLKNGS